MKAQTWDDILADRSWRDLPYKIETNRYQQIVMCPASAWHGNFEHGIGVRLRQHLPADKILHEAPVRTSEGVRVADVGWISRERWLPELPPQIDVN